MHGCGADAQSRGGAHLYSPQHTPRCTSCQAGGSSLCGMSEQAADLLPFVQAKVCNKMGDKTPQSLRRAG